MFEHGVCRTRRIDLSHGLVFLLMAVLAWSGVAAAAAPEGVVVHEGSFDPGDISWESDFLGKRYPVLEGTRSLTQPGLPRLPVKAMTFLVPLGQNVTGAVIEPLATSREAGKAPLALAVPNVTSDGEVVYTTTMSRVEGSFPSTWGEFTGTHVWRGYRLVTISVYPVREIRTKDGIVLEYLNDYAVRLVMDARTPEGDVAVRERLVPGEAAETRSILADLVANPEAISGYTRQEGIAVADKAMGFQPTATPSLAGSAVANLIITNLDMADEFQVLADFKTAQGLPTVVATVEDIVANNRNGADVQETIRMFIRDAYEMWGVSYVMLGGDSDILPPRYVTNTFHPTIGYTLVPCDLYFACLDGNYNANGNDHFGEPASSPNGDDLVDFAEEIYLGRAAVSTSADAAVFVSKNLTYETTSAGSGWTNRTLLAAEVLFPDDWPEGNYINLDGAQYAHQQVNDYIIPCTTLEYTRMYQTDTLFPWDIPLSRAAFRDTVNTGNYGIVNQIGHGSYFNMMLADANFMTSDADQLSNGDHLFMLYALNCASGAFDKSCLLERFVQNPNGGSVCSLGSVRAAFPNAANNYQQEFFAQLYCYGETRVGRLMALSRLPFIGNTTANFVDRWTFENYTLLGDPTLGIWSGIPSPLTVSTPEGIGLGPQVVTVTVAAMGSPMEDAQVCLAMGDEAYVTGTTNGFGTVELDFLPVNPGSAVLTVTGRNMERTTVSIPVTAGSSYLALGDMPLVDDGTGLSTGNGNGLAEAGETIELIPSLMETGGSDATGITATLSTPDAGLTWTVASNSYGNVSAGGTTAPQSPFAVALDPGIADGTIVALQMTANSSAGESTSEWAFGIKAPSPEISWLDWDDTQFGNGDGVLDDGEVVVVDVMLKNYGTGTADAIYGVLSSTDPNVQVLQNTALWTSLGHLDEAAGSTNFAMSYATAGLGGVSELTFTDNYGRVYSHTFELTRPEAPGEIVTDASQGADVIALFWSPPIGGNILGYHVYRSQDPGGSFARVNRDLIIGSSYFRDDHLDQLTRYYYQVAAVDSSFVSSDLSHVVSEITSPAELDNFPVDFAVETSGHLAVGDVDGDGDKEIVLGADQIYVWHHDGLELLDGDHDAQTLGPMTDYPPETSFGPAGIVLGEFDGEGGLEMVVSESTPTNQIHLYHNSGVELPGWPRPIANLAGADWNWATPAVGDIDGDGENEIVVATLNGWIHAWNADGTEVRDGDTNPATIGPFYFRPGSELEWSRSGPALFDLDGDDAADIIFGTRNDSSGLRRLMAIRYDGTDVAGFPYVANGPVGCNPAVGDLDNDGQVEIVFFDSLRYVYAVRADGTDYPGFPFLTDYLSELNWVTSPALGDMDGDGMLEIVYAPNQSGQLSRLVVVDTDYLGGTSGTVKAGFPVVLPGSSEGSPVLGDLDGDQAPEIIHGIGGGDLDAPYNLYVYHGDGESMNGFPITLGGPLMPSAVITDIDRDWDVDIVFGGWDLLTHVWDLPGPYDRRHVPWPTYGGNWRRDGVYQPLSLVPVPEGQDLPAVFTVGQPYPNPFNPSTTLRLYVPKAGEVDLGVYDLQGRRVRTIHTGHMVEGWRTFVWDGKNDAGRVLASGLYFMRAKKAEEITVRKMTLIK